MSHTGAELRDLFLLCPDVVFLNHGAFGACPRPVFESYQRWQRFVRISIQGYNIHSDLEIIL